LASGGIGLGADVGMNVARQSGRRKRVRSVQTACRAPKSQLERPRGLSYNGRSCPRTAPT
jgi:hypothetical protein